MAVTTISGIIGYYFFITTYNVNFDYYKFARIFIITLIVFFLIGLGIRKSKLTIKGFSLEKIKQFVLKFPKDKIIFGFVFSLIRYAIFSFQFYFLLQLFGVKINYLDAMVIISSMYLLASIIPSIFIFDVVIRGSVALYLFAFVDVNELTILSIITFMWLFNFVIPSVFGSYYVFNFNLPKSED